MMLRHPSEWLTTPREEGCSSTAIGTNMPVYRADWINLANRGSARYTGMLVPAVP
jgi:hypothetical protein